LDADIAGGSTAARAVDLVRGRNAPAKGPQKPAAGTPSGARC